MLFKGLTYGKYGTRGLSCNNTLNICQDVLKSANLLYKQGFDDSQSSATVYHIQLQELELNFRQIDSQMDQQISN